jgi:hypothetical protein
MNVAPSLKVVVAAEELELESQLSNKPMNPTPFAASRRLLAQAARRGSCAGYRQRWADSEGTQMHCRRTGTGFWRILLALAMVVIPQARLLAAAPGQTSLTVDSLVGCYELSLGPWSPPFSSDFRMSTVTPPARIQLRRNPLPAGQSDLVVVPMPGGSVGDERFRRGWWHLDSPEGPLQIHWAARLEGVAFGLKPNGDELKGSGGYWTDALQAEPQCNISLRRIPCKSE